MFACTQDCFSVGTHIDPMSAGAHIDIMVMRADVHVDLRAEVRNGMPSVTPKPKKIKIK